MNFPPPTGVRKVRVLRTIHHSVPVCHPRDPNLDLWESYDTSAVVWIPESIIDPSTDKRLDL